MQRGGPNIAQGTLDPSLAPKALRSVRGNMLLHPRTRTRQDSHALSAQLLRSFILLLFLLCLPSAHASTFELSANDGIIFVQIPAGAFTMGTTEEQRAALIAQKVWSRFENCELPAHTVTISKPFLIGKYEVTQKQ